ncbi:MAG TPA: phytanoyl-CoA dioxygenase family protein, partial [Dongiaceae bacterium]|nr:phytanoyl-CoA dioxygenase family protein [Dongiaceae bacterium]
MAKPFVNPLPGVPAIESPFFPKLFADADPETYRTAFDLHTKGYAVIDFPELDFDTIAERIKRDLHDRFDWEKWRARGSRGGLRVQDAWKEDENVKRLATNPKIIALLSRLYGRPAWPFQTLNFPIGTQQHFHTDAVHFNSVPERFMCGLWVALEDIRPDNGPLFYYPGSHTWPIYGNDQLGRCAAGQSQVPDQTIYHSLWKELVATHEAKAEQFLARKGQALIWAANLLHGGSPQIDLSKTRWSQVTHYFFADCAYYTPMYSDPFYGSIAFRHLRDIRSGEVVENSYLG